MLKSMTGYGLAKLEQKSVTIGVEIKTLNSKFLDTQIRMPRAFSAKEIALKNILSDKLIRGKVSVSITFDKNGEDTPKVAINEKLFGEYYTMLAKVAKDVGAADKDILKMVLLMPEVQVSKSADENVERDWKVILKSVNEAIKKCDEFRMDEGERLQKKIASYIKKIDQLLSKIIKQDPKRTKAVRERIDKKITELKIESIDKNRFEQELIYYIEKLDISEEKVRLKSHLNYFMEVLGNKTSQGKKLGFISQEIGREINTIGSKANDAAIQKDVVGMKEELEKIKEQLLNIL